MHVSLMASIFKVFIMPFTVRSLCSALNWNERADDDITLLLTNGRLTPRLLKVA